MEDVMSRGALGPDGHEADPDDFDLDGLLAAASAELTDLTDAALEVVEHGWDVVEVTAATEPGAPPTGKAPTDQEPPKATPKPPRKPGAASAPS